MKKITTILFMLFTAVSMFAADESDMPHDAKDLVYNINVGWNLGNSLESYSSGAADQEVSWGNPKTTQAMIDAVKAAGFNAIRIPVRWYPHYSYINNTVTLNATWLARVKEVIGYCMKDGMYVIMNTHHELWLESHATYADSTAVFAQERALWKTLANAFADYDETLMFAGTNEVHIPDVWNECTTENAKVQNKFNQIFVDVVRASGGKNLYRNLIVQTYACNDSWGIKRFVLPTDPTPNRMIVELHAYEPYSYAMNPSEPNKYWGTPYSKYGIESGSQESHLNNLFNTMKTNFVNKGYPVIIGECGAIRHTSPDQNINDSRAYYLKTFISKAKSYGIVPFLWDNGATGTGKESYGLFKRNVNMTQVDNFSINAIMDGAKTAYPYTTGINMNYVNNDVNNGNIYDCQGALVKRNAENCKNLHKGLYIFNGKKYIIK